MVAAYHIGNASECDPEKPQNLMNRYCNEKFQAGGD
jgi:hypothetical protein